MTGDYFRARYDDPDQRTRQGPGARTTTYAAHADVARMLAALPDKFAAQDATRANELGFQRLSNVFWADQLGAERAAIGLALGVDDHARVRPLLADMVGPGSPYWNGAMPVKKLQSTTGTKSLRCTAMAWMLIVAQCSAVP